jgi:hypothetical protein
MIQVHPQYVIDEFQKKKAVLLTFEEWKTIVEALEELEEIQLYDIAKAGSQETIPFEQAVQEIEDGYEY